MDRDILPLLLYQARRYLLYRRTKYICTFGRLILLLKNCILTSLVSEIVCQKSIEVIVVCATRYRVNKYVYVQKFVHSSSWLFITNSASSNVTKQFFDDTWQHVTEPSQASWSMQNNIYHLLILNSPLVVMNHSCMYIIINYTQSNAQQVV
jgi:hypothetical protein